MDRFRFVLQLVAQRRTRDQESKSTKGTGAPTQKFVPVELIPAPKGVLTAKS